MESDRKKVIIWVGELKKKIQFDVAEKQVIYRDRDLNENFFSINDDILSRHIVMIGGSGSGKTNVFNLTLDQLRRKRCLHYLRYQMGLPQTFWTRRRYGSWKWTGLSENQLQVELV